VTKERKGSNYSCSTSAALGGLDLYVVYAANFLVTVAVLKRHDADFQFVPAQ
jgi:hypothetical protein